MTDSGLAGNHSFGRDRVAGAVTIAAILLFVGTGSTVLAAILQRQFASGINIDRTLVIALILNIAVILFGWRRHGDQQRAIIMAIAAEERTRTLAATDPLTGLLTRRALLEQGATLIQQAARRHKAVALLILNIDHFKAVNDRHGHGVGDGLLRRMATEISAAMPSSALVARLGADEFAAVILFDQNHTEPVTRLAAELNQRLAQDFTIDGIQLHHSASIGIAGAEGNATSIDSLLRSADIAVDAARKAGRNRALWFDTSMERELHARNELEAGLRSAIPQHQITPYFEQQIDLTTGRLIGFEVLARWDHPVRGMLLPEQFIGVAEEAGLIADLSLSVLGQAFAAARDWHPGLSLSVNIAPQQLKDPWLAQKLLKLLAENGFPPHRLEIDITEAALFDNVTLAQTVAASLKNQGIRIALDDFGTGYSSIAHLRAIAFDRIKIDRSFVTTINDNQESAAIVTALCRLAESLNLPVAAEGIEDKRIEERLRALGCGFGQGYLYGRPVNAANARSLLAERRLIQAAPSPEMPLPTDMRQAS